MEYFKKANGLVYKITPAHDINSLKERFTICDADGNEIKAEKPKKHQKRKKKKKINNYH